jgi:hypothetical protein
MAEKEKIIESVYYNRVSGFGSVNDTFRQAKEKDASITINDVKEYLNKLKHKQTHFTYKKYNSFVSPHPLFEIEIDLIDLTSKAEENNGYRYGLVGIDNFTKYAHVVPIKSKKPGDITKAMEEILNKIGISKQVYSDQEGSFHSPEFIKLMNKHGIKHVMVVGKAHVVERFNRTLKEKLTERLEALGEDTDKWTSHLTEVVNKYNNTEHRTIKMTPAEARKDKNTPDVSFNLWKQSKRDRIYPELKIGDNVRVMLRKDNKTKGYFPKWSGEVYKVAYIKDSEYLVSIDRKKVYQRFELLKV